MTNTAVLMSIKPQYADLIFSEQKTIELRRVCPKVSKGDKVLVYVSGPRMALAGGFEVESVISGSLEDFRRNWLTEAGVSEEVFDRYFSGVDVAYGIRIGRTWRHKNPVALSSLRKRQGGFTPPQSYRYLRNGEFQSLSA